MGIHSTLAFILQHPLNRNRRFRALLNFAHWQIVCRIRSNIEFRWISGAKLVVNRGMTGATGNIYCGLHEYVDMSFVLHFLRPGDMFLDVGANVGSYTILASSVCGAKTLAIEPDPKTARYLERNIAFNKVENLCCVAQTAVGRDSGTISFTVGKDTVNQVWDNAQEPFQTVPLSRIDSVLGNRAPTLMKMDIEGYEVEALYGAERMLSNANLVAIIIENTEPEVVSILDRYGFSMYSYDPFNRRIFCGDTKFQSNNGIFIKDVAKVKARLSSSPCRTYRGQIV